MGATTECAAAPMSGRNRRRMLLDAHGVLAVGGRTPLLLARRATASRLRTLSYVALAWVGIAISCGLGNAGLDLVIGPSFHWREYAVAERAARAKVAISWLGSALLVPGQERELRLARALLAAIEEERSSAAPNETSLGSGSPQ